MMGPKVHPLFSPDRVQMMQHLQHLFGDQMKGMVEIAWTPPDARKVSDAQLFDVGALEDMVAFAAEKNAVPGQCVYVGAALRKPSTFPNGRTDDADYYGTTAAYVDLDDPGAAEAVKALYESCKPTMAVVTGRQPHTRVQLWWKLEDPFGDPERHSRMMAGIAKSLNGDSTVTNPSRVMRLGGTVAWPKKDGRVTEMTSVVIPHDRPATVYATHIEATFPGPQQGEQSQQQGDGHDPISGKWSARWLIGEILAGRRWHINVIHLTAHWIGKGWSDAEILATAAGLTLPGYTVNDTIKEMQDAINGGRRKFSKPNIDDEFGPEPGAKTDNGAFNFETGETLDDIRFKLIRYVDIVPNLISRYLVKGLIPAESLVIAWGPPKCGKSFWFSDVALHIAANLPYRGLKVRGGPVVYIAAEGASGFMARVDAWKSRHGDAENVPFYVLPMRVDLVEDCARFVIDIKAQVGDKKPVLVVIDTLNRTFTGSESSDEDMTAYVKAADAIKEAFGCSTAVIHHCGVDGTRPRGHTSLTGAADAQISIVRDGSGLITSKIEWMKDGPEDYENQSRLEVVDIGNDEDGDAVTTCVITDSLDTPVDPGAKLSASLYLALIALKTAIAEVGEPSGQSHIPASARCVPTAVWRKYYYLRSTEEEPDGNQAKRQKAFKRASMDLQSRGYVGAWNDLVWVSKNG